MFALITCPSVTLVDQDKFEKIPERILGTFEGLLQDLGKNLTRFLKVVYQGNHFDHLMKISYSK